MLRKLKTVKWQVLVFMVGFAVMVSALVSAFFLYLTYDFQKTTVIQSAQYNLKLMADTIGADMNEVARLAAFSANTAQITDYFTAPARRAKPIGSAAYDRLHEEYAGSRCSGYVQRLIVTETDGSRLLQVGNFSVDSYPVTKYSLARFDGLLPGAPYDWRLIGPDPFNAAANGQFLAFYCPVYSSANRSVIGLAIAETSAALITDKLTSYTMPEGSDIYISFGDETYLVAGARELIPAESENAKGAAVSYAVRDGLSIAQTLPPARFLPSLNKWAPLLVFICAAIAAVAFIIINRLDKGVSRPAARIRAKLVAAADGDFSADVSLESDSEMGEIGGGVNHLCRSAAALMRERLDDETRRRDLEYRMLQAQINPHFLYNTLNSIKWMATIQNATGIAEMTTSLSRLLKTVSKDTRKEVTLAEELDLLSDYVLIQRYRYGGGIEFAVEIESPELLDAVIPRFSIQPLVENAIFHGIEPKGAGRIVVSARREPGGVAVSVSDDGVGMSAENLEKILSYDKIDEKDCRGVIGCLGVRNVSERARLAFGEGYGLAAESELGSGTRMRLLIPYKE
ncbi:MAG: histidine kinase [Clostridiales bacterium]|jgi:two-component system sensor histidine kinase YesM|nr:histidine kinase [Clostridiales bacterium]